MCGSFKESDVLVADVVQITGVESSTIDGDSSRDHSRHTKATGRSNQRIILMARLSQIFPFVNFYGILAENPVSSMYGTGV